MTRLILWFVWLGVGISLGTANLAILLSTASERTVPATPTCTLELVLRTTGSYYVVTTSRGDGTTPIYIHPLTAQTSTLGDIQSVVAGAKALGCVTLSAGTVLPL